MADLQTATDIRADGWFGRIVPPRAAPFAQLARFDRPIGTWLLLFPCWWGMALGGAADLGLLLLFAIGAVVMRGAGCTYNDIVDRDFDGRVARTALRPIPSGRVSVRQAWGFIAVQLAIGAAVLAALPRPAIPVALGSIPLVACYPFMKRITYWPQAWLGLTFNWGALVGYAAATGDLGLPALLLYAAGIAWTLGYDTIYAHQDKEDDALIGVRSTALLFGAASRRWILGFYALALVLLGLAGAAAGLRWPFFAGLALVAAQLASQLRTDLDRPAACLAAFRSNRWTGWLVLASLYAGHL